MNNIGDVISSLGGGMKVAALLGVSPQAITNMKARGTFPPRHWPALIAEARRVGKREIDLDFLATLGQSTDEPSRDPAVKLSVGAAQ